MRSPLSANSLATILIATGLAIVSGAAVVLQPALMLAVSVAAILFFALVCVPRTSIVAVAVCISLATLVSVPILRIPHTGTTGSLATLVLVICVTVTLIALTRRRIGVGAASAPVLVVGAFYSVAALSTSLHSDPSSWRRLTVLAVVAVSLLTLSCNLEGRERRTVLRFILAVASFEAILAIWEVLAKSSPLWIGAVIGPNGGSRPLSNEFFGRAVMRAQGTFGHPLPLSYVLVIGFVLVVMAPTLVQNRTRITLGALLFVGCICSGSRSAALIMCLVLLLGLGRSYVLLRALAVGAVAVAIALFLFNSASFGESGEVNQFASSGSVTHRVGALASIARLTDQNLIAVAVGNGSASTPRLYSDGLLQNDGLQAVDNQLVLCLAEVGIFGVCILLAGFLIAISRAQPEVRAMLLVTLAMLGIFDIGEWPATLAVGIVALGLAFGEGTVDSEQLSMGVRTMRLETAAEVG